MIKSTLIPAIAALCLGLPLGLPMMAQAAGGEEGGEHVTDYAFSFEGPFGSYDRLQLQRGFQIFHEVCSACHGLKYVSFRDLGMASGPAFPPEQVKAIAALYDVPDPDGEPGDTRPGLPSDKFPANTGVGAPDLSMMAKARAGFHGPMGLGINQFLYGTGGPEYIASLLQGYTGEDVEQAGSVLHVNKIFPAGVIAMSQPLAGDDVEYTVFGAEEEGNGEEEGAGHGAGYTPPSPTLEQEAQDVAAFLMWAAEPHMTERKAAGFRNIVIMIVLAVLLYYTNKKLWAPIKRKDG